MKRYDDEVFHGWKAVLSDTEVNFYVSIDCFKSREDSMSIPKDSNDWDLVLTLKIDEDSILEEDGDEYAAFESPPKFFDHSQLARRLISEDEFVKALSRILNSVNKDLRNKLQSQKALEDSEWNLL